MGRLEMKPTIAKKRDKTKVKRGRKDNKKPNKKGIRQ
jgi:hypothetical protein